MSGHLIDELIFDISFDEADTALQDEAYLRDLLEKTMLIMDQILAEFDQPGKLIRFDRIELDLGDVDRSDLQNQLASRLAEALRNYLQILRPDSNFNHIGTAPNLQQLQPQRFTELDQLQFFLQHGRLSRNLDVAQPDQHGYLLQQVLSQRSSELKNWLHGAAQSQPVILKRLSQQFSPDRLLTLFADQVSVSVDELQRRMTDLMKLLRHYPWSDVSSITLVEQQWQVFLVSTFQNPSAALDWAALLKCLLKPWAGTAGISQLQLQTWLLGAQQEFDGTATVQLFSPPPISEPQSMPGFDTKTGNLQHFSKDKSTSFETVRAKALSADLPTGGHIRELPQASFLQPREPIFANLHNRAGDDLSEQLQDSRLDSQFSSLFSADSAALQPTSASVKLDDVKVRLDSLRQIEMLLADLQGGDVSATEHGQQLAALYTLIQTQLTTTALRTCLIQRCSDTTLVLLLRVLDADFCRAITLPLKFRRVFQQSLGMTDAQSWQRWRIWFWQKILELISANGAESFDLIKQGKACLRSLAGEDVRQYQQILTIWQQVIPTDSRYAAFSDMLQSESRRNISLAARLPGNELILQQLDLLDGVERFIADLNTDQQGFSDLDAQLHLMQHILDWLDQQDPHYTVQILRQLLSRVRVTCMGGGQDQAFGIPASNARQIASLLYGLMRNLLSQRGTLSIVQREYASSTIVGQLPVFKDRRPVGFAAAVDAPADDIAPFIRDMRIGIPEAEHLSTSQWLDRLRNYLKTEADAQNQTDTSWREMAAAIERAARDASRPAHFLRRTLKRLMDRETIDLESLHCEQEETSSVCVENEAGVFASPSVDADRLVKELRKGSLFVSALQLSASQWRAVLYQWISTDAGRQFPDPDNIQALLNSIDQTIGEVSDADSFLQKLMAQLVAGEILDVDLIQSEFSVPAHVSPSTSNSTSPVSSPLVESGLSGQNLAVANNQSDSTSAQLMTHSPLASLFSSTTQTATSVNISADASAPDRNNEQYTRIVGANLLSPRDLLDLCHLWLNVNQAENLDDWKRIVRELEQFSTSSLRIEAASVLEELLKTASYSDVAAYTARFERPHAKPSEPLSEAGIVEVEPECISQDSDLVCAHSLDIPTQHTVLSLLLEGKLHEIKQDWKELLERHGATIHQTLRYYGHLPRVMEALLTNCSDERLCNLAESIAPQLFNANRERCLPVQAAKLTLRHLVLTTQTALSVPAIAEAEAPGTQINQHAYHSLEQYLRTGMITAEMMTGAQAILHLSHSAPEKLTDLIHGAFVRLRIGAGNARLMDDLVVLPESCLSRLLLALLPQIHVSLHKAFEAVIDAFQYFVAHHDIVPLQQKKWYFTFNYLMIRQLPFVRKVFVTELIEYLSQQVEFDLQDSATRDAAENSSAGEHSGSSVNELQRLLSAKVAAHVDRLEQAQETRDETEVSIDAQKTLFEYSAIQRILALGPEPTEELFLVNAGMVLAAPYLPRLFNVLKLTADGQFVDQHSAQRAVHVLQFLVSGQSTAPEYQLILNKLLCGIKSAMPIEVGMRLTKSECDVADSLLVSMIQNWKSIGNTTISGLRQTFFQRQGVMQLIDDAWQLRVQSGVFDMLLDRLPWSFSIIKYPWMERPIHVTWR